MKFLYSYVALNCSLIKYKSYESNDDLIDTINQGILVRQGFFSVGVFTSSVVMCNNTHEAMTVIVALVF